MATVTLPHTLTNGSVADANQVMDNFNAIVSAINGNLDSSNISGIAGADVLTYDLNGGQTNLDNFVKRFRAGLLVFSGSEKPGPHGRSTKTITFSPAFPGNPAVICNVSTTSEFVLAASPSSATANNCTIYLNNNGSTDYANDYAGNLTVFWIAIYTGQV